MTLSPGASAAADRLYAILDGLRACLCEQLDATTALCTCELTPYATPAQDCDCKAKGKCGTAYVRLSGLFPSRAFPTQATTSSNCGAILAAGIELGVTRCLTPVTAQGGGPSAVDLANAVQQQGKDAMAMWAAYTCCTDFAARDHVIGAYFPRDGGGCIGGVWPATVHLTRETA